MPDDSDHVQYAVQMPPEPDHRNVAMLRDINYDTSRRTASDSKARPLVYGDVLQPARPRHILMRPRRRSMPAAATSPHGDSNRSGHALHASTASSSDCLPSIALPPADLRKVRLLRRKPASPRAPDVKLRQPSNTGRPPSIALPATSLLVASASPVQLYTQNTGTVSSTQPMVVRIQTSAIPFKGKGKAGSSMATMSAAAWGTVKRNARAVKVRRIAQEILESERAYVRVLDEIHDHYYVPLQQADKLNKEKDIQPIFDQITLKQIFSNFEGIRVLAKRILETLEIDAIEDTPSRGMLAPSSQQRFTLEQPHLNTVKSIRAFIPEPKLTPVNLGVNLQPILPYLRIYNFFVTDFDKCQAILREADASNQRWRDFAAQRRKPKVGNGLNLSAMLLNIVQRIPRYRLLLQDLLRSTSKRDADYSALCECLQIVEDVANQLQTHIKAAEASMVMLDIHRKLQGLPFNLVEPGRSLIKTGILIKSGRKVDEDRAFFLFSDMLMYADVHHPWQPPLSSKPNSPNVADIATFAHEIWPDTSQGQASRPVSFAWPLAGIGAASANEYVYKNSYSLRNVTTTSAAGCSFHIMTPNKSFLVIAGSTDSKAEWIAAIRQAKLDFLSAEQSLAIPAITTTLADNVELVKSATLADVSSHSENPDDVIEVLADSRSSASPSVSMSRPLSQISLASSGVSSSTTSTKLGQLKVHDDYNAPVWTPDHKVTSCMRCHAGFGLFLRKHHCRLCGDVVCWDCSTRRFAIPAVEAGGEPSVLRACEDCYIGCFGSEETPGSGLLGSRDITSLQSMQSSPSSVFSAAFSSLDVLGLWSSNPPSPNLASSGKLPKSQPSSRDLLQDILNKQ